MKKYYFKVKSNVNLNQSYTEIKGIMKLTYTEIKLLLKSNVY